MVEAIDDSEERRQRMVAEQLRGRGIRDPRVLAAMGRVPRELFVDESVAERAYGDHPLPIGYGQTISQPFMVARMAELLELRGGERVLDVGAGSGYQTAILAELAGGGEVFAVERVPQLAALAARRLLDLGYQADVCCCDGTLGLPAHAPYDAIAVAAGAPQVPPELLAQLADGGRLVLPVGDHRGQRLLVIRRSGEGFEVRQDISCVYVDLIGRAGWELPGEQRVAGVT